MGVNEVGGYDLESFEKEYDVTSAALEPFDLMNRGVATPSSKAF